MKSKPLIISLFLLAGAIALLYGCAIGNKYRFTSVNANLSAMGHGTIAISVVDRRSFVRLKQKEPTFIGVMQAEDGTLVNVRTGSRRPLADAISHSVRRSLRKNGFDMISVIAENDENAETVRQRLVATGAPVSLQIDIYEWFSEANVDVDLSYDLLIYVMNGSGEVIAHHRVKEKTLLKGDGFNPTGFAINAVSHAYKEAIEDLLNERTVQRALESPSSARLEADEPDAGVDGSVGDESSDGGVDEAQPAPELSSKEPSPGGTAAAPAEKTPEKTVSTEENGTPPPGEYTNMRSLKEARRAGAISRIEFARQWRELRKKRQAEIKALRAELRAGKITPKEFSERTREIKLKYEGR